ncbi:tetratricopeptide repeat protein [Asticcacaulis sp. 201]|uniref:tetratricopeptide repeat protein n=1 Tax=Asticcacaulis sp. 201 TaxID=3028787 RepID=UPI00291713C6|nr:tetratricopeptide repeat protein [Asticcacaulis sp. 201]MDV6332624.1 tetratricopeptide repeat protein [Asticcacaulis sp. 201]
MKRIVFSIFAAGLAVAGAAHAADTVDQAIDICRAKVNDTATKPDDSNPNTMFCRGFVATIRDHDSAKAHTWFLKSAEAGYAVGQYFVATQFEHGDGVDQDIQQALAWHLKAAEQGLAESQHQYAHIYFFGRSAQGIVPDPDKALPWFRKAADQGYAESQAYLGLAYELGTGVPQSYTQAQIWYRLAAAQDNGFALASLGDMYQTGRGGEKDEVKGFEMIEKAARMNMPTAQLAVAHDYRDGIGVKKDAVTAFVWFALYSYNKDGERPADMDALEKTLTPAQVAEATTRAQSLWTEINK